jgi:hypothetical protein
MPVVMKDFLFFYMESADIFIKTIVVNCHLDAIYL